MAWYLCELEGSNFAFQDSKWPDGVALLGFYASRMVEANSTEGAERAAIGLILDDPSLKLTVVRLEHGPHPMVKVNEVFELEAEPENAPGRDYSFFPMQQSSPGAVN